MQYIVCHDTLWPDWVTSLFMKSITVYVAIVRIRVYTSDIVIGTGIYIVREAGRRQWSGVA